MSSPPADKPYKSRLFNFLNRQYIRINSGVSRKLREWSYAVKGGLEIIFFPLLRLWEIITKTGNRSFASAKTTNPHLPPAACDEIIRRVTEKMVRQKDIPVLLLHDFQGLACRLQDRCIVAVMANNQMREIIPATRQGEISDLIETVLASHEMRLGDKEAILWLDRLISSLEGYIFSAFRQRGNATIKGPQAVEQGYHSCYHSGNGQDDSSVGKFSDSFWPYYRLKVLILAAIDYFFGKKQKGVSSSHPPSDYSNSGVGKNHPLNLASGDTTVVDNPPLNPPGIPSLSFRVDSRIDNLARFVFSPFLTKVDKNKSSANKPQKEENVVSRDDKYNGIQKIRLLILAAIDYFFGKKNSSSLPHATITPHPIPPASAKDSISPHPIPSTPTVIPSTPLNASILANPTSSAHTDVTTVEKIKAKIISLGNSILSRLLPTGNENQSVRGEDKNITKNPPPDEFVSEKENPFQLKLLILAAIEYFFGKKKSTKSKNRLHANPPSPPLTASVSADEGDESILKKNLKGENANSVSMGLSIDDEFSRLSFPSVVGISNSIVERNPRSDITASVSVSAGGEYACLSSPIDDWGDDSISVKEYGEVKQTVSEKNQKSETKDYCWFADGEMEANIVEIKYEKHLLQIILEKLDELMLHLEELIIGIINCVVRLLGEGWKKQKGKIGQRQEDKQIKNKDKS
ncbi:MAG: hypothetical protein N3D76_02855 [Geminocystis sp.]|nr:hypothetical protein [Geminocystis sp.]HIK37946.1 hypothetical protein [Geminocystis sp. M7585_C2015_104]